MKISEENNGKFNSIVIPASRFQDFAKMLGELVAASDQVLTKPSKLVTPARCPAESQPEQRQCFRGAYVALAAAVAHAKDATCIR